MKKEKFIKSIGLIAFYYIIELVISLIYSLFEIDSPLIDNIVLIIEVALLLLIVLYILRDKIKGQFEDFKKNWKEYVRKTLKYWLVGFILMIIANFIINIILSFGIAPNEEANREILESFPIFSIIYMCIIGPITEELVFRLNFKDVFDSKKSFVIFTGIFFGAMHVFTSEITLVNLLYLLPYSILGLTFSKLFSDTRNIYTSILAHIIHNSLTILVVLLGI